MAKTRTAPLVRYAPLGELVLYDVKDDELTLMESLSSDSNYLSFGVSMISTALGIAGSVALVTDGTISVRVAVLWTITGGLALAGVVLIAMHRHSRREKRTVFQQVRARLIDGGGGKAGQGSTTGAGSTTGSAL